MTNNTIERRVSNALARISESKSKSDIRFVDTVIGQYRLEAEKHKGFVKWYIHNQATDIEKQLKYAIKY